MLLLEDIDTHMRDVRVELDRFKRAQIDVVATVPGEDELTWTDVTIRRSTAVKIARAASCEPGTAAPVGDKRKRQQGGGTSRWEKGSGGRKKGG